MKCDFVGLPDIPFARAFLSQGIDKQIMKHDGIAFNFSVFVLIGILSALPLCGEERKDSPPASRSVFPGGPEEVVAENFDLLKTNSPFLRSLDLSESLILTSVSRIGSNLYVTLFELETKKTHIVSNSVNHEGWRLVEVSGKETDLETVTAQVSIAGGEVFSVRYDKTQLKPEEGASVSAVQRKKPPVPERDYREGISGDGHRGAPPPELIRKLSQLREDDRNRLIQQIREIRDKGVSSEERQVIFGRMVDRALQQRR